MRFASSSATPLSLTLVETESISFPVEASRTTIVITFFPANDVGSGTLTADFRPAANLSVRLEYRDDRASAPMYFRGQVATEVTTGNDVPTAKSQQTMTLGAVAWF